MAVSVLAFVLIFIFGHYTEGLIDMSEIFFGEVF